MGSRSGEEMLHFKAFLGGDSKVIGVEITETAKTLPNTIISDFHKLPNHLEETFDFVYSNSHDQSNSPKVAFQEWIKVLKPEGLLILEHSRAHGKRFSGRQDPFGVETEVLPYLIMNWFTQQLILYGIFSPTQSFSKSHKLFIFQKK
jgi:SAM-dependent methyltransferase